MRRPTCGWISAIGYKELKPYVDGLCSEREAAERLKQATRRYAKRQLSWFRRAENARTLYVDDYADAGALAEAAWEAVSRKAD